MESYIAFGDPTKISPETARLAIADVQKELADLRAMQQVGVSLKQAYDAALKGKAE